MPPHDQYQRQHSDFSSKSTSDYSAGPSGAGSSYGRNNALYPSSSVLPSHNHHPQHSNQRSYQPQQYAGTGAAAAAAAAASSSSYQGNGVSNTRGNPGRRTQRNGVGYSDGQAVGRTTTRTTAHSGEASHGLVNRALTRAKTLTRPDRHVQPAPLINPHSAPGASSTMPLTSRVSWFQPWSAYISVVTFWAIPPLLRACGMKEKAKQRAWKEKVALCSICAILGAFVGFATIGLNRTLCPADQGTTPNDFIRLGTQKGYVGIEGWMFSTNGSKATNGVDFAKLGNELGGQDITNLFDTSSADIDSCRDIKERYATLSLCSNSTTSKDGDASCTLSKLTPEYLKSLGLTNSTKRVGFSWEQVAEQANYMVLDGFVCNMSPYIATYPTTTPAVDGSVDTILRTVLRNTTTSGGKDGTRLFYSRTNSTRAANCIKQKYRAGHIDKVTPGCFASQLFLYVSLVVILAVVLARFFMAIVFSWFLSSKLVQPPKNLKRQAISPAVMPIGANASIGNPSGTAPWVASANAERAKTIKRGGRDDAGRDASAGSAKHGVRRGQKAETGAPALADQNGMLSMAAIGAELFCVCLVTCYSEGLESIKGTLDSIAATDYADSRKLLFVVCDGMITGSGEKVSTPDICVGLLDADSRFDNPQPMSYLAVAGGRKQHNQALVYAGHYSQVKGHRTPCIVVVKTGTAEEARDPKPGNRGKRDSQMVLMNFFSRVTYNDRMTPLDYDLFRKCQALMGVTPDFFEVCLMVDADTVVYPDSLKQLVNCMQHDSMIMGVCGETRIANKRQSWVTAIQVYEYFISHHLSKAFESVFGGVTCLPGCFSMYRLKARKANEADWVPVLAQSTIVSEYSQAIVETLHEKNLLLLGEDRFLTTLMLRTFPHRKMMFCPQARCRTVAPDTFKVLLSQRRRWINSTVHNLMELVRVQDLCGTFCFSMQFMVFMDLVGTVVLPVAISLTFSLIIQYCINPPSNFGDAIPLMLLGAVLGLPAVLILLATGKIVYVAWMAIYMLSLPIWNFVLPLYAFWHFDDFSWGQTRQVEGEKKDRGHGDKVGETIEVNAVPLRRWEDWERSRLRKIKREHKRRQEFQRAFGTKSYHNNPNTLSTYTDGESSRMDFTSDTGSMFSSEDDRWGLQIGQYNEDAATSLPPVGLYHVDDGSDGETVDHDRLEAMLDAGWDDDDDPNVDSPRATSPQQNLYQAQQYLPALPNSYYRYEQTPVKMYQLSDNGPVDSNSSLTGLTAVDPNDPTNNIDSPVSPRKPALGTEGRILYDGQLPPTPTSPSRASPGRSTAFDPAPVSHNNARGGTGHVKRRSGGGYGNAALPEPPHDRR